MSKVDALFLYGSRARGDGGRASDVDLLGVVSSPAIEKPFDQSGISLHLYPWEWMKDQAQKGTLFLSHVVHEAVAINDPDNLLDELRRQFTFKSSYASEVELGCKIILALLGLDNDRINRNIIRKYFWGLRTALMGAAANQGSPSFSARDLEKRFSIEGLANHINTRDRETAADCKRIGARVYELLVGQPPSLDEKSISDNLNAMFDRGGMATVTAGEIIYGVI
jgi:hypothetical protein